MQAEHKYSFINRLLPSKLTQSFYRKIENLILEFPHRRPRVALMENGRAQEIKSRELLEPQ